MAPTATESPSKRSDDNTTPITPTPVKAIDDGKMKSSQEANLGMSEAGKLLESRNSRLINNEPTGPSSETNTVESSGAKDAEEIRSQNNPANKKQKSSEEEAADTEEIRGERQSMKLKKKKKKGKKKKDSASATTPESPVRNDLQEAIEFLENNCATMTLKVHPTMIPALAPLTIVTLSNGAQVIQNNNVDCNHNTPNLSKGYQILNNVLNNPLNHAIDSERTLGGDQQLFAVSWDKVCPETPRSFIF